jgi:hypothetical protein
MKQLLTFLSLVIFSGSARALTECANKSFGAFDPHKIYDLADHRLGWRLYLPLLGSARGPGLARSFSSADRVTWTVELREDIRFRQTPFWGPSRAVEAGDVVASLRRQLSAGGELTPYHYAKVSGVAKRLRAVEARGPRRLELTFRGPVREPELVEMLSSPAGITAPADFLGKLDEIPWTHFPPTQEVRFERSGDAVELVAGERRDRFTPLPPVPPEKLPEVCNVLINPRPEQEAALRRAGASYRTELRGHTRVYVYLSKTLAKPIEARETLRRKLRDLRPWPEGYLPLRGYLIGGEPAAKPGPGNGRPPKIEHVGTVFNTCVPTNVDPAIVDRVADLLRESVAGALEVKPRPCEELLETDQRFPGSIGSLVAVQHRRDGAKETHMPCRDLAFPDMFCSDGTDPAVVDRDLERFGRLVPLIAVERKVLVFKKR